MYLFQRLANFRDLGGISTADGGRIKKKRLLRAGEPYQLSQEDIAQLAEEYQLRYFFDLRSTEELEERPDDSVPGAQVVHIDVTLAVREGAASSQNLARQKADHAESFMMRNYEDLVTDATAAVYFRRMLEYLLEMEKGSALFHCFAGKDRTGMAVAVTLTALGVSRDEIMKDYLQSNELRSNVNRIMFEELKAKGSTEFDEEAFHVLMNVKEEYLLHAYTVAERLHGSFESFVFETIGLTPAETARLRALYLE